MRRRRKNARHLSLYAQFDSSVGAPSVSIRRSLRLAGSLRTERILALSTQRLHSETNVALISDRVQYARLRHLSMTAGVSSCSSGPPRECGGPHRAAVMDIQMSMIGDIMIWLSAVDPRLIVLWRLMSSCWSRRPAGQHASAAGRRCGYLLMYFTLRHCRSKSPSMTYAFHYPPVRAAACRGINCISRYVPLPPHRC